MASNKDTMKKCIGLMFSALCAFALLSGCGEKRPVLYIYSWSDYISPDVITAFEKEYNCLVKLDSFDSNEAMYAKLKAGSGGYDLVLPSSYYISILKRQNMIQALDMTKLKNVTEQFDGQYVDKAETGTFGYHVPYAVSTVGFGVDKRILTDPNPSWNIVTDPAFKGRVTIFNDMRHTLGAALKTLGYSLNSVNPAEIEKARDLVISWKTKIAKFENEQYKTGLASGEFLLAMAYNADIVQVKDDNPQITFVYPKEGFEMMTDDFVVPSDAKNVELAHAFINFLYRPEMAKLNMNMMGCLCPVKGAYPLVDESVRSNPAVFMSSEIVARGEFARDIGDGLKLYTQAWDKIKSSEKND